MTNSSKQAALPSIILGIPGLWKSRAELLSSVIQTGEFVFAGNALHHPASGRLLTVDVYGPDPRLLRAFTVASVGRIPPSEVEAIGRHTMTLYLIGPGGSLENARFMAKAGAAILRAGGIAVKIESSGLAHPRDRWLELADQEMLIHGLHAYVVFVNGNNSFYSCGMHNLGFRDALFFDPPENASELLRLFLQYSITPEKPLSDQNTVTLGNVRYRIRASPCTTFPQVSEFHNPYGYWTLEASS